MVPAPFLMFFHPDTVFSSIDAQGRYAYSNQPNVIVWNMAQLATSLVPLMPDQDAAVKTFTNSVHAMPDLIHAEWLSALGRKIGIETAKPDDEGLITDLLSAMASNRADFTNTFRALFTGNPVISFLTLRPLTLGKPGGWRGLQMKLIRNRPCKLPTLPIFHVITGWSR